MTQFHLKCNRYREIQVQLKRYTTLLLPRKKYEQFGKLETDLRSLTVLS